jgi:hypothetical protein
MQVIIGEYENIAINTDETTEWTVDCAMDRVDQGTGLGGVNHYAKKSIRALVNYYERRLLRDSYYGVPGAKYEIVIELSKTVLLDGERREIRIPIECK